MYKPKRTISTLHTKQHKNTQDTMYLNRTIIRRLLSRPLIRLPLESLSLHIPLTHVHRNGSPEGNPEKRNSPAYTVCTRRGNLVDHRNDSKGNGEDDGWNGPEP